MTITARPVTHYELKTKRGTITVFPQHRANTGANIRAGVIYVMDIAGNEFPAYAKDIMPKCGGI